ncbi:hypothetical protein WMY93_033164 [Mugilogobius chulae]|uniref:Uncharacterized protein n=1 Tax=Mugilogobius chulae TaxID=88201 RepID=A0AAW0MIN7_9GOBI
MERLERSERFDWTEGSEHSEQEDTDCEEEQSEEEDGLNDGSEESSDIVEEMRLLFNELLSFEYIYQNNAEIDRLVRHSCFVRLSNPVPEGVNHKRSTPESVCNRPENDLKTCLTGSLKASCLTLLCVVLQSDRVPRGIMRGAFRNRQTPYMSRQTVRDLETVFLLPEPEETQAAASTLTTRGAVYEPEE